MGTPSLTTSAWAARRLPDESIFDRTLRGDPVAFSEVYRRYQKRVYGYCLARSLDPGAAADATQEVFMKLLRAEPGSIESPQAWLFTVARNVVIDAIRKRTRTPEDAGIDEESLAWDRLKSADTADEVLARSDARNVFLALRTMRPRYRTALVMREIHGQSAREMAEALETSPGAVDTLVSRARDAFGVAYASVGDLPEACRANVELIYRGLGTGITEPERAALQAHLAGCDRCRAEAKRAENPRHLAALLPFLVPAKSLVRGVLGRAALAVRMSPDVVAQQSAAVLSQPHTWTLATKIAAGIAAVAIVTAPIAATTLSHPASTPARSAQSGVPWSPSTRWGGGSRGAWMSPSGGSGAGLWSGGGQQMPGAGAAPSSGSWTGSGWTGDMSRGSTWSAPKPVAPKPSTSTSRSWSGSTSGSRTWGSGSGSGSGSGMRSPGSGSWSSGGSGSSMGGSGGW